MLSMAVGPGLQTSQDAGGVTGAALPSAGSAPTALTSAPCVPSGDSAGAAPACRSVCRAVLSAATKACSCHQSPQLPPPSLSPRCGLGQRKAHSSVVLNGRAGCGSEAAPALGCRGWVAWEAGCPGVGCWYLPGWLFLCLLRTCSTCKAGDRQQGWFGLVPSECPGD